MKKLILSSGMLLMWLSLIAQSISSNLYQDLSYRLIGPFRASRTVAAVGIPAQPNVFYVGVNNGGVWKTDDFGRTWNPIFDDAPTGSVGDIAIAPSNPKILYIGSGEGLHRPDLSVGDGIFKSVDGGNNWEHVGLGDIQQVARVIIHPKDPNIVFVAGLGHPYGPNEERGVFRSNDGGKTWEKVLYINHNTGASQVEFHPKNPKILFAVMWEHREGPWENARFPGPNSGLYKSRDGGKTWKKQTKGLPTAKETLGRIGVGISPSNPKIVYATVNARQNAGIYKSTDEGESWTLINTDRRLWGRGDDFAEIKVHPNNSDVVFVGNIASYRSDDGGKTWTSIKGAPGGDDYHRIWINPEQPDIMLFAADQGATITVNGGRTWSSWYNQPTSQIYHVTTDNNFPYWVYGGQQESGAIGTSSRGNGGQISFRDWVGIGADEYAYIAPDPLDPDIIYGGRVVKFNKRTGQTQNVAPEAVRSGEYRILRTMPLLFHPADPKTLLFATNVLWKTTNGGQDWTIISPDLTREQPAVPESVGDFTKPEMATMPRRGVIYAVGPSPLDHEIIWAGTDDGLMHITKDGGATWQNITPSALAPWDKVSQVDAGHFDESTAYIAINAIRKDDMQPHIFKTRDNGKSWTRIVNGLPDNGPVNVVREDPLQPGLLYAGTERTVFFSIDDGANWQSLRMNLPPTSIRDLVIHEDDLVIGTHGRSIWILDNISHLRELAKASQEQAYLFTPRPTYRVRWNMFSDTPLPPEEPAGKNPPDGAIFDYYLNGKANNVKLTILNTSGEVVREFSSNDKEPSIDSTLLPHPTYWIRPFQNLSNEAGHHRFTWDLRWTPPKGTQRQFSISAVHKNTPDGPHGPLVHPGTYTVRLDVDGKAMEETLEVKLDPRISITDTDLKMQNDYSLICYNAFHDLQTMKEAIDRTAQSKVNTGKDNKSALMKLRGEGRVGDMDIVYGSIYMAKDGEETIVGLQRKFLYLLNLLQAADARPTTQAIDGVKTLLEVKKGIEEKYSSIK